MFDKHFSSGKPDQKKFQEANWNALGHDGDRPTSVYLFCEWFVEIENNRLPRGTEKLCNTEK